MFKDWENGTAQFPALGDLPSPDPQRDRTDPVVFGSFPAYQPYVPELFAPTTYDSDDIFVIGDTTLEYAGDLTIGNIRGDPSDGLDSLTLQVEKNLTITGFVSELAGITIEAASITLADDATISTRRVAAGANHWDVASTGNSGNITLTAPVITIGKEANILAHADGRYTPRNLTLNATDNLDKLWSFLSISTFKWASTTAAIKIGDEARLTGYDITLGASATTKKVAELLDQDFSHRTQAVLLHDVDGDGDLDLIMGNSGQPNRFYKNDGTAKFDNGTDIETTAYKTTFLALGDVDADGAPDLIVGNNGQPNRIYKNDGSGSFDTGTNIDINGYKTTSLALANIDSDDQLELIVGTDGEGILRYEYDASTGKFGAGTVIDDAVYTTSLAPGHVDADGAPDLIVGNNGQQNRIYLNTGGTFGTGKNIGAESYTTTSLALSDVDGDSDLDLIVGNDGLPTSLYRWDTTLGVAGYSFGEDPDVDDQLVFTINVGEPLEISKATAVVLFAEAEAGITLGAGTYLDASSNVALNAMAYSEAKLTTVKSGFVVTFGSSSPTAFITIENGVFIGAGSNFEAEAFTTNYLNVTTFVPTAGESSEIALSLATAEVASTVDMKSGSRLQAASATFNARNDNSFRNTAIATAYGTKSGSSSNFGITVALSFNQSIATVEVSGVVDITGDLQINSEALNPVNSPAPLVRSQAPTSSSSLWAPLPTRSPISWETSPWTSRQIRTTASSSPRPPRTTTRSHWRW